MKNDDELTPQNWKILCGNVGLEIGLPGYILEPLLIPHTAEALNDFKSTYIESRHREMVRQGHYSPRSSTDGRKPTATIDPRSPAEKFAEWAFDAGL